MVLIDANAILRVILNDNADMAMETVEFIKQSQVLIRNEILAEIVFVLQKVYKVSKADICKSMASIMETANINAEDKDVALSALKTFKDKNLDFADCLLFAYYSVYGIGVFTFDEGLRRLMITG